MTRARRAHGADNRTIDSLAELASNHMSFSTLCAAWERGDGSVRTLKREYEAHQVEQKKGYSPALVDAWRHRPLGCQDSKTAILLRARSYIEANRAFERALNVYDLSQNELRNDLLMKQRLLTEKIRGLRAEYDNLVNTKSLLKRWYPGLGMFRQQQRATGALRMLEAKLGGKLSMPDRDKKFPELAKEFGDVKETLIDDDADGLSDISSNASPSLLALKRKKEKVAILSEEEADEEEVAPLKKLRLDLRRAVENDENDENDDRNDRNDRNDR